jgi:hypothetical protein
VVGAVLVTLGCVAAACSSSSDDVSRSAAESPATTPSAAVTTTPAAAPTDATTTPTSAPAPTTATTAAAAITQATPGTFLETFDGAPTTPQPWKPANWDVVVHSRGVDTWDSLEPMEAMHGPDCAAPPAHHQISSYDDAVFLCKDHVMTSILAEEYGVIYLTPNQQVDFSNGEAVISWDMSTLRTSVRDWVDLWITPFADNLELPLEEAYPDLSGPPRESVHITMDQFNGDTWFKGEVFRDFQPNLLDSDATQTFQNHFEPDGARRDRFELHISKDHIKFGMPKYDLWWIDTAMPGLDWSKGVVQFGHHSYNPRKQCVDDGPCDPGTWHWDNISISPAVPFTILRADRREVYEEAVTSVSFPAPAPKGTNLRFAGIGTDLQASFDGGATWTDTVAQAHIKPTAEEHFGSFWMPVPAGTTRVMFRGTDWWGGRWDVRDITLWSEHAP